jgi:uncharacterized membrane protein
MTKTSKIKKGSGFIVFGGILLAVGLALTAFGVASFFGNSTGGLQQIKAPGKATVKIDKAGPILIYQEETSPIGSRAPSYGSAPLRRMKVAARHENGQDVAVVPVDSTETYEVGDRNGISVWKFEAPVAGNYTVETELPSGMQGEFDIAVGPSNMSGALSSLLALFIGLIGGSALDTLGLVLIIIGFVKRSWSKRQQQEEAC